MGREKGKKSYDEGFKLQIVDEAKAGGKPLKALAKEHGISVGSIRGWMKRLGGPGLSPPVKSNGRAKRTAHRAPVAARKSNGAELPPQLVTINSEIAKTQARLSSLLLQKAAAELTA